MKNYFPYSDDNKRYHTLAYHNKTIYGCRVFKATVDAGLTCPNADGSKGSGGCVFCAQTPPDRRSISEQFTAEKSRILAKYPDAKIMMYYGMRTNTYCGADHLEKMLAEALSCGAFAVSLATRPDCLDEKKARILAELPLPLTVELGLQTVHDSTAALIRRGHSFGDFLRCYEMLRRMNVRVCVHIIDGLPGEDREMMLETAKTLGRLRPDGVKIHSLHILRGTELFCAYQNGEYAPLEMDEYIETAVRQLELLPPETVIERITGDGDKSLLAAPLWSMDKIAVLGGIDRRMTELNTFQGRSFNGNGGSA